MNHIKELKFLQKNPRKHNARNIGVIADGLNEVGAARSIVIDENNVVLAGNGTIEAAGQAGLSKLQIVEADGETIIAVRRKGLSEEQKKRLALIDNRSSDLGSYDAAILAEYEAESVRLSDLFTPAELQSYYKQHADDVGHAVDEVIDGKYRQTLAERFGVPPFSVLDARQGYWQERKRAWLSLGIQSEVGRDEELTFAQSAQTPGIYALRNEMRAAAGGVDPSWPDILEEAKKRGLHISSGTSIFDPVLCELAYRWFCPEHGRVLDPFAGGSVRGLVAAKLGRGYIGVDLSERQVNANRDSWNAFKRHCEIETDLHWISGDSQNLDQVLKSGYEEFDFIFSCPPYADLEKYSDDARDLSNMEYDKFLAAYFEIIKQSCERLKDNHFACFVVGDIRDKSGFYRNFVSETIRAFEHAGMTLYNEAILVTQIGSLAIRVNAQFGTYRKLGKTHQNILVFYKGNPKKIPEILGETEFGDLTASDEAEALATEAINELSSDTEFCVA